MYPQGDTMFWPYHHVLLYSIHIIKAEHQQWEGGTLIECMCVSVLGYAGM